MEENLSLLEQDEVLQLNEVLNFDIADQIYSIEVQYITEIIGLQPITIVPKVPSFIKGVINLRGKVVPVMSIRKRFEKEEIPYDDRTCIIVVEKDDVAVGLIVDRVRDVITVNDEDITSTPDYKNVNINRYIKSIIKVGNEIKFMLNCDALIFDI